MGVLSEFSCYTAVCLRADSGTLAWSCPWPDPKASRLPVPCFPLASPPQVHLAIPCLFLHLGSPSEAPESRAEDLAPLRDSASPRAP